MNKSKYPIKELNKTLKASSDINRLRILKMLEQRDMCVCEIAYVLGIAQPSVSRHLKKLKSAGFIDSGQDGFWTNYFLDPKNKYAKTFLGSLRSWLIDDEVVTADLLKLTTASRDSLYGKSC